MYALRQNSSSASVHTYMNTIYIDQSKEFVYYYYCAHVC